SSILSLASFTRPRASRTTFSSIGVNCLHGPHQGAQKSTRTGWRRDSWITSAAKEAVETSFMTSVPCGAVWLAPAPAAALLSDPAFRPPKVMFTSPAPVSYGLSRLLICAPCCACGLHHLCGIAAALRNAKPERD